MSNKYSQLNLMKARYEEKIVETLIEFLDTITYPEWGDKECVINYRNDEYADEVYKKLSHFKYENGLEDTDAGNDFEMVFDRFEENVLDEYEGRDGEDSFQQVWDEEKDFYKKKLDQVEGEIILWTPKIEGAPVWESAVVNVETGDKDKCDCESDDDYSVSESGCDNLSCN